MIYNCRFVWKHTFTLALSLYVLASLPIHLCQKEKKTIKIYLMRVFETLFSKILSVKLERILVVCQLFRCPVPLNGAAVRNCG